IWPRAQMLFQKSRLWFLGCICTQSPMVGGVAFHLHIDQVLIVGPTRQPDSHVTMQWGCPVTDNCHGIERSGPYFQCREERICGCCHKIWIFGKFSKGLSAELV